MSSFTQPLFLSPRRDDEDDPTVEWETSRSFSFEIGMKGSGLTVTVPEGTKTDMATVPRLLWPVVPPHDPKYAAAFVLHDYLCRVNNFSRVVADAVLYDALRVLGATAFRACVVYWSVATWRLLRNK